MIKCFQRVHLNIFCVGKMYKIECNTKQQSVRFFTLVIKSHLENIRKLKIDSKVLEKKIKCEFRGLIKPSG